MAMEWRTRRISRRYVLVLAALLAFVPLVFAASAIGNPGFVYVNDENGANDQPGQKDLTRHGVDTGVAAGHLGVAWNWDITGLSGGNTGDACALFDTDTSGTGLGKVDFALCETISGKPAAGSFTRIYSCGDDKVDRCTSPIAQVLPISSSCSVAQSSDDPFPAGDSYPKDTKATCDVVLADVGATAAKLVNTCSYPSQQPNSDPSDCVLLPRDAFLVITKNAGGRTDAFNFSVDSGATFQVNGGSSSSQIPITTVNNATHTAAEGTVPSDFTFNTASCSGATDSNGSLSGQTISGINAAPDDVVTCTFTNDLKPLPAVTINKSCTGGGPANSGDRFQPTDTAPNPDVNAGSAIACGSSTTYNPSPGVAYSIGEAASGTTNLNDYTTTYSATGCSGTLNRGDTATCTITNALKAAPAVTINKSCTGGGPANSGDRFQPTDTAPNPDVNAGSAIACGSSTTYNPSPGVAYSIGEAASGTTNLNDYTTTYSATGCSGTLNRGDTATCTITNALKAAPQLKIVKSCTNGAPHASTDRFQPQNNLSGAGLSELACGGDETISLTPDAAYSITEVAGATSPATDLSNYNVSYSAGCANANGLPRGSALVTCTITNELKKFTVITLVCDGNSLHSSSVTLDGETHPSLASSSSPSEADLCGLLGARFDRASGTYSGSVTITP